MPPRPRPPRPPAAYRQVDLIRDLTLGVYIIFMLTGGLQRLVFGASGALGGGSIINQGMTFAVLGSAMLCVLYQRIPVHRVLHGIGPFVIPALLVLASLAWTDYFGIATRRVARFWIELAGVIMLVSCYRDSRSFLRTLFLAFSVLTGLDLLSLAAPSMSITSIGFAGIHGHKNTLGSFAYAAIPIFLIGWRWRLLGRWSILGVGLAALTSLMLVASLSKTAVFLVPFCMLLTYLWYRLWQRGTTTQLALGGLFTAFVLVIALPIAGSGMSFGELIGEVTGDPTITGRSDVWNYTIMRVGDRGLAGMGYGSFWEVDASNIQTMNSLGITFAFNQSHNGYIGVYAELGWLGVIAIVLMCVMAMAAILRRVPNAREWPLVAYALYTTIGYILYNVTETSFFRVGFDTWVEFVIIVAATTKLVAPVPVAAKPRRRAQRFVRRPGAPRAPRPVHQRPVGRRA